MQWKCNPGPSSPTPDCQQVQHLPKGRPSSGYIPRTLIRVHHQCASPSQVQPGPAVLQVDALSCCDVGVGVGGGGGGEGLVGGSRRKKEEEWRPLANTEHTKKGRLDGMLVARRYGLNQEMHCRWLIEGSPLLVCNILILHPRPDTPYFAGSTWCLKWPCTGCLVLLHCCGHQPTHLANHESSILHHAGEPCKTRSRQSLARLSCPPSSATCQRKQQTTLWLLSPQYADKYQTACS